ncbi:phosphotransferase family protein [Azospirillum sp. RWY-5-1]|uniref:Phosphotransferase family protein n=2 Tax=Azospirillum oleiclasticum TaxID=2735135 RepID=A0ABX2TFY2_9PROT|nr:phosphotransferase family protein [Azospirillum oleiclasticum]NYZ23249.1 phosphotransferase family protein [Azospirillum oleiclasticum]
MPLDDPMFHNPADTAPLDWPRIATHLAAHGLTLDPGAAPRQFRGGLANLNFLVTLDGRKVVLRTPPPGPLPPGANDMRREHRILSCLWRALPLAPRSLHLCEEEAVAGRPFILLEYRAGVTLAGDAPPRLAREPAAGARLGPLLIDALADIHAVDPASVGLDDLGHPEGFLDRAVTGWVRRATLCAGPEALTGPTAELAAWLGREVGRVRPAAATLLHNDFKLDNLILDPHRLAPVAILDWDQGTRGDPLFDLATLLSYWTEAGDPPAVRALGQMPTAGYGFPSRREAAERYAARTGRDLSGFRFHRVLALFKLAVVFQQLHARHLAGTTTDPRYAGFGELAEAVLDFTHDVSQGRVF